MRLCCGLMAARRRSAVRSARLAMAAKVGRPLAGAWRAERSTTWQDAHQRRAISRPCSTSCAAASAGSNTRPKASSPRSTASHPGGELEAVGMDRPVVDVSCAGEAVDGRLDRGLRAVAGQLDLLLGDLEGMTVGIDEVLEESHDVEAHHLTLPQAFRNSRPARFDSTTERLPAASLIRPLRANSASVRDTVSMVSPRWSAMSARSIGS